MRPLVGRSTPVRQLNSVVLPAPLGPMMARRWPAGTRSEAPSTAWTPPNERDSATVSIAGVTAALLSWPRLLRREPPGHLHPPATLEALGDSQEAVGRPQHGGDEHEAHRRHPPRDEVRAPVAPDDDDDR